MSNDTYIALDVHAATTTYVVLNSQGKETMHGVCETKGKSLVSLVKGLSGSIHLTFEEGTHAAWLYEALVPHVNKLIVCNPRENRRSKESKTDRIDAGQLVRWLRSGDLSPVYHGQNGTRYLKELVRGYESLVDDFTRAKNRMKAIYRSRGISTAGTAVYDPEASEEWMKQLDSAGLRSRVEWLLVEIEALDSLIEQAKTAVEKEGRRHQGCRLLRSVPGIGWIRAATIVAHVSTPFRFRTKRQFWSYCGFAVVTWSSSDWELVGTQLIKKSKPIATRGLNTKYNRRLKHAFKSAAITATSGRGVFKPHFETLVAGGMRESMARLTVARKIASTSLMIWKKGERFDLAKAVIKTE